MDWNRLNPKKILEDCWHETAATKYVESLKPHIRKRRKNGATHDEIASYINNEIFEELCYESWVSFDHLIDELEKQFPYLHEKLSAPVELN